MKAIQIKQTGGPEVMELVDLPVPQPKSNEAVVKIKAAGVNFIDVYNREGRYKAPLPLVLGQEAAGTILALGSDLLDKKNGFSVGDPVAYTSNAGELCRVRCGAGGPPGEDSGGSERERGCGRHFAGNDGALPGL